MHSPRDAFYALPSAGSTNPTPLSRSLTQRIPPEEFKSPTPVPFYFISMNRLTTKENVTVGSVAIKKYPNQCQTASILLAKQPHHI